VRTTALESLNAALVGHAVQYRERTLAAPTC
jgi:hypothetical protein